MTIYVCVCVCILLISESPTTLLNLFIISWSILVECLEFLKYNMSSGNRDSLISFFICRLSVFFFCLIAPPSVLSTTLKRSGASVHPCLVSNFFVTASSFSPFRIMPAVGSFYCIEICSSSPTLSRTFIMNVCWIFSKASSFHGDSHVVFFFKSTWVVYHSYPGMNFRDNANLVIVDKLFAVCLYFVYKCFTEDFLKPMFIRDMTCSSFAVVVVFTWF